MKSKLIKCYISESGRFSSMMLKKEELLNRKSELRKSASSFMEEFHPDHIIYYWDKRDDSDNIIEAHFYYDMVGWDDEKFYSTIERMPSIGLVGAIHNHNK